LSAEGFACGFKAEKNDFFGVGVGVGVGAALSDKARPTSTIDIEQKILRDIIQLCFSQFLAKLSAFQQRRMRCVKKTLRESLFIPLTARSRTASIGVRARENFQMPTTEVILTDNVPGLGAEADVVKVRRGYARNYLLPQG
jgi:hypothetical protein